MDDIQRAIWTHVDMWALAKKRKHPKPTLEDYIEACAKNGIVDHSVRAQAKNDIYIHPNVNGPTVNIFLAADGQVLTTHASRPQETECRWADPELRAFMGYPTGSEGEKK